MLFPPYEKTGVLYHVVHIMYLKHVLEYGIKIEERNQYSEGKYMEFNRFLDSNRLEKIPPWVIREKAFFASLNFKEDINWHSHSALLAIRVQEESCWVANENLANEIYDPFVLSNIKCFDRAKEYMRVRAEERAKNYWEHSYPFREYLSLEPGEKTNYDEEVMVFHDIPPSNIECLMIITDHKKFTPSDWQKHYRNLLSTISPM